MLMTSSTLCNIVLLHQHQLEKGKKKLVKNDEISVI